MGTEDELIGFVREALSMRWAISTLIVSIAGLIFGHYLRDLRADEKEAR